MAGRPLTRIASQLLNTPLMVTPQHGHMLIAAMRSHLNVKLLEDVEGIQLQVAALDAMAATGLARADTRRDDRKVFAVQDGVAIIPITGTLTKSWGIEPSSGFTGYDGIKTKLMAAMQDDSIDGVFLDIDSPGGQVAGCFDLVDTIYAVNKRNGGKPIYAIANEQCCSAAFAIGSAADELFVPRTGEVGSVGVIMIHQDVSKAMDEDGVKVTVFRSGAHKAEGNPYEAITDEVAKRIQTTIDGMRELFVETISRNMKLSKKVVRETEALTYIGAHARDIGFANAVASEDQAWDALMKRLRR